MPYLWAVFVSFERIVHELQEVRSYYQIIFKHYDTSVLVYQCSNPIYYIICKSPVMFSFSDMHRFESLDTFYILSHLGHGRFRRLIFSGIGIDKQLALRSQFITEQRFNASAHMFRTVIYKQ